ncbi:MAG: TIM barrel protein [Rhodospirillaceae bacterium]
MAAKCGFKAVECQRPYDMPPAELRDRLADAGVEMVLINTPPSPRTPDENGLAIFPDRIQEFREVCNRAIGYAAAAGVPRLHVVAGRSADAVAMDVATATFIDNIRWAGDRGREQGVRILIEPLNGADNPGYFLTTAQQGADILAAAEHDNLFLQYDLYHAGVNGEDIPEGAKRHLGVIDHIQMAGVPGRHEPDTGAIDILGAFAAIEALGYTGWIGAEYRPAGTTLEGLGWGAPYGIQAPDAP